MIKFICFGSGSSGNCYYLCADGYAILIDLGIGVRMLKRYCSNYGLPLAGIKAILVTHDHADHVKAVGAFSHDFRVPVYALKDTFMGMERNRLMTKKVAPPSMCIVQLKSAFALGPFSIEAFYVPHDSAACCGYAIHVGDVSFCLITDAGHVTDDMRRHLAEARYVVVEANYDEEMLRNGPYPEFLQQRIIGPNGHMSNAETADLLATNLSAEARHVWLCHLSQENNRPELALSAVELALRDSGRFTDSDSLVVQTLERRQPTGPFELH